MIWLLPIFNVVAVMAATATSVYWLIVSHVRRKSRRLMPELALPEGELPLIGHSISLLKLCKSTLELWQRLGEFVDYYKEGFHATVGHQVWLFIPDIHVVQEVMASQDTLDKSYVYQALNCITDGVFIAPGIRWRKLRKRLNLTFSVKQIDSYMEAVNEKTETLLNVVMRRLQQGDQCVDIQPYIARCFFDVMTNTHFGANTDEQVHDHYKVAELANTVIEQVMEKRLLKPHLHIDLLFKLTEVYKVINELKVKPINFINDLVENRLKLTEEARASGQVKPSVEKESPVYVDMVVETLRELNIAATVENIQRNSSDLLIAGSDTTSVTTATLLYHLAVNKDVQQRVYDEVSRLFGSESFRPLTRQELNSLVYLEMSINEALRWSSPPGIIREMGKDVDVGKYTIPKWANVYLVMASQHHNPEFYERVEEFYPEHFSSEAVKSRPKMGFIPFSAGPRNCPGKQFAYILLKAAVAVIVNNYLLETDLPLDQVRRKMVLMTQHVQGYPIRFVPRNHNTPTSVLTRHQPTTADTPVSLVH